MLWFGGTTPQEARTKFNRHGDFWSGPNFSVVDGQIAAKGGIFSGITAVNGTFSGQITASMLHLDMATNSFDETINGTVFLDNGGILPSLDGVTGVLQLIWFAPQITRGIREVRISCPGNDLIFDDVFAVDSSSGKSSILLEGPGIFILYGFRPFPEQKFAYWFYKRLI